MSRAGKEYLVDEFRSGKFTWTNPGNLDSGGDPTDKGLEYGGELIAAVRDAIGWDMPLSVDASSLRCGRSYKVADMDRRLVSFRDESEGKVTAWKWDFGDGATSTGQNPVHQYKAGRDYTTILEVDGPAGKSRLANVWGVSVK